MAHAGGVERSRGAVVVCISAGLCLHNDCQSIDTILSVTHNSYPARDVTDVEGLSLETFET